MCLFLNVPGLHCCADFSLVAVHRLLTAVASLVEEHIQGVRASGDVVHFWSCQGLLLCHVWDLPRSGDLCPSYLQCGIWNPCQ